jgi:hypothetical protein
MSDSIKDLLGLTVVDIVEVKPEQSKYIYELQFKCNNGKVYCLGHHQDCCEDVYLEDVNGDFEDIKNHPILKAEMVQFNNTPKWTFYHVSTIKGTVSLRWCGDSNGYYSEEVDFWEKSC